MKELLEKIVADYEAAVAKFKENRGIEEGIDGEDVYSFHFGLDSIGSPISYGHADDTYSDGFDNGRKDGEYDLALKLLAMIEEAQSGI